MRHSGAFVVTQFNVPPHGPKPVVEADENFRKLAFALVEAESELAEARELKPHAVERAHQAAAEHRVDPTRPKPPKTSVEVMAEFDARIGDLEAEVAIRKTAVDEAGDVLWDAINENKDAWIATLIERDAKACARLDKAIAEVDACLAELAITRTVPDWLRDRTRTSYAGGRVAAGTGALRELLDPPRQLAHYVNQKPVYNRYDLKKARIVKEWADGSPLDPETDRHLRSGRVAS